VINEEAILSKVATTAQQCFQHHPVIILGSGASIVHGLRGMTDLAQYLINNLQTDYEEEADSWLLIRNGLAHGDGLEETLLSNAAPQSLVEKIVRLTWNAIMEDDLKLMERAAQGKEQFSLSSLLQGMFKSTHMEAHIVTPNYDRVAEYAADIAGFFHTSGFSHGIIRNRETNSSITLHRGAHPERAIRIWKVHGSLDWFEDHNGRVISLPSLGQLPDKFTPMIVTPGVSKYERTHDEPFRSAIQGADRALEQAPSFLCVGYGFRDRHIQPKIVDKCRVRNIPIVILARTLTSEAKAFLKNSAGQAYMALEMDGDGTRVYFPENPEGVTVAQPNLWSFDSFNNMVL